MSIFALHSSVLRDYRDFVRSFFTVADVHGPDFPGETFRVLKEKETAKFGEYRTRRLVLEAWDRWERGERGEGRP